MRFVGQFIHKRGNIFQALQLFIGDAVDPHFDFQVGDNGNQVGVSASLSITVDGALHLCGSRLNGSERVGDRHL